MSKLGRVVVTGLSSRGQRRWVLELCSKHPEALVVACVAKADDDCVEQALLLGAVAAIEMTSPVDDAAHLIAEAMKGLTFLPVNVVRHLLHTAIPTRELTLLRNPLRFESKAAAAFREEAAATFLT